MIACVLLGLRRPSIGAIRITTDGSFIFAGVRHRPVCRGGCPLLRRLQHQELGFTTELRGRTSIPSIHDRRDNGRWPSSTSTATYGPIVLFDAYLAPIVDLRADRAAGLSEPASRTALGSLIRRQHTYLGRGERNPTDEMSSND